MLAWVIIARIIRNLFIYNELSIIYSEIKAGQNHTSFYAKSGIRELCRVLRNTHL